ncbi:hypothetical protein ACJ41O_014503 [Fusarium nematophilum]
MTSSTGSPSDTSVSSVDVSQEGSTEYPTGTNTETSTEASTNTASVDETDTVSGGSTTAVSGDSTATGPADSTETESGAIDTTSGDSTHTETSATWTESQASAHTSSGDSTDTEPGATDTVSGDSSNTESGATGTDAGASTQTGSGDSTDTESDSTHTATGDLTITESGATSTGPEDSTQTGSENPTDTESRGIDTTSGDATNTETATNTGSGDATDTRSAPTNTETGDPTDTESGPVDTASGSSTGSSGDSTNTAPEETTITAPTDAPTETASRAPTETSDGGSGETTNSASSDSTTGSATKTMTDGNGGGTNTGTISGDGPSSTAFITTSASGSTTAVVSTTAGPTDVFVWTRSDGIEVTFTSTWAIIGTHTVDLPSVTATSTITEDGIEFTLFPTPTSAPGDGDDDDDDDNDIPLVPCIIPPIPICIPCAAGLCFPPDISAPPPVGPLPGDGDDDDDDDDNTTTSGCKTATVTDEVVSCTRIDGSASCTTLPASTVVECSAEPATSTTLASCPLPTSSEEDGSNDDGCDPPDQVQCDDDSCKGKIAPSPVAKPGPQCFAIGKLGCECTPSDDTPRLCPKESSLPCDSDCDAQDGTCRGRWEGCKCGGQATTTSSAPPTTTSKPACPTNQSCDDCSGEVTDGDATCRGGDSDGCSCVPSADTPGFECGEPRSCQENGCNGRGDGAGGGKCQDAFKGCACLADPSTPGFCSSLVSCSFGGCQGIAVEGQQFGVCQADSHKGCSCILPAEPTTTAEPEPPEPTGDPWMLRLWGDQQCTLGTLPFLQQPGRGPSKCMQTFGAFRSWCAPVNEWPSSLMVRFYDTEDCTGFSLSLDITDVGCPGEIQAFAGCTENDNLMSWQVVNAE